MKIYFACSITGGRAFEEIYQVIVNALEAAGHHIPTSHLARSEVMGMEKIVTPVDVYTRDIAWINESDLLIAEVSTPSHGVGYEIAYALSISKPVLCCYRQDMSVSKMILGNTHPCITVRSYVTPDEAVAIVKDFAASASSDCEQCHK